MNQTYPIIRRKRRPLIGDDQQEKTALSARVEALVSENERLRREITRLTSLVEDGKRKQPAN